MPKFLLYIIYLCVFLSAIGVVKNSLSAIRKNDSIRIMRSWHKTKAFIKKISLEEKPDLSLDKEFQDVFTINTCDLVYSYTFNNKNYESSNIGINEKDNNSSFQGDLCRKLSNAEGFYIYVNPQNPNDVSLAHNNYTYREIGNSIICFSFLIFLSYLIYTSKKYPSDYVANQIKILKI
ncbi:hypothetical protein H3Z83_06780 [Tenacibaculum sp. S7007]|uniref:DUF3592 domain-containing protein n=1 Tax=Tenacibaculum pelagium TaxID=2759527 RepID=A0A839AMB1_9FLAO|nr:hypothetical protein [Tenacibaculum pelagium]MBA6156223.1 hypothetical protein [Tenacibaculum pelagium]